MVHASYQAAATEKLHANLISEIDRHCNYRCSVLRHQQKLSSISHTSSPSFIVICYVAIIKSGMVLRWCYHIKGCCTTSGRQTHDTAGTSSSQAGRHTCSCPTIYS